MRLKWSHISFFSYTLLCLLLLQCCLLRCDLVVANWLVRSLPFFFFFYSIVTRGSSEGNDFESRRGTLLPLVSTIAECTLPCKDLRVTRGGIAVCTRLHHGGEQAEKTKRCCAYSLYICGSFVLPREHVLSRFLFAASSTPPDYASIHALNSTEDVTLHVIYKGYKNRWINNTALSCSYRSEWRPVRSQICTSHRNWIIQLTALIACNSKLFVLSHTHTDKKKFSISNYKTQRYS